MQDQEPQYFTKFRVDLNDKLDKRFDAHAEQIAHLTEEMTGVKKDITTMKGDMTTMKSDITGIKEELVGINVRLDGHAEQIAKVSEDTTLIKSEIKEIRGDIKDINKKIDTQGNQITEAIGIIGRKADTVYVDDINFRTKKLEKVAFA